MNQKYQVIIQPAAQKAIEEAYFWLSNHYLWAVTKCSGKKPGFWPPDRPHPPNPLNQSKSPHSRKMSSNLNIRLNVDPSSLKYVKVS